MEQKHKKAITLANLYAAHMHRDSSFFTAPVVQGIPEDVWREFSELISYQPLPPIIATVPEIEEIYNPQVKEEFRKVREFLSNEGKRTQITVERNLNWLRYRLKVDIPNSRFTLCLTFHESVSRSTVSKDTFTVDFYHKGKIVDSEPMIPEGDTTEGLQFLMAYAKSCEKQAISLAIL